MTSKDKKELADKLFEAAVLVEFANTGEVKSFPDIDMYQQCSTELSIIAKSISNIRAKGFGKDIKPNAFTK